MGKIAITTPKYSTLSPLQLSRPTLGGFGSWFVGFARSSLIHVARQGITTGHLTITDSTGTYTFGEMSEKAAPHVMVTVKNDVFWTRVLLGGDLGFSEAYLVGDADISDLKGIVDLWIVNREGLAGLSGIVAKTISAFSTLISTFLGHTLSRSRLDIIASYDTSNALFQCFLSKDMQYSCALWDDAENGVTGDLTVGPFEGDLEAAQKRKLHHVLRAARVKPGYRLLEFGSGWGSLAITAARDFGCTVDTLTLSIEQKALAEERIREAGLENSITVHLMDYRDLPRDKFEGVFDAFVSIEMVEHVGSKNYNTYFKVINWALKKENATAVVCSSTIPESRYTPYQEEDFIRRYMWPGSSFPSPTVLNQAAISGSRNQLVLETVENHGAHYPRTLRTWGYNLKKHLPEWRDAIVRDQPALHDPLEFEAFIRKWKYMFDYAAAGMERSFISCHMLSWRRGDFAPPGYD